MRRIYRIFIVMTLAFSVPVFAQSATPDVADDGGNLKIVSPNQQGQVNQRGRNTVNPNSNRPATTPRGPAGSSTSVQLPPDF